MMILLMYAITYGNLLKAKILIAWRLWTSYSLLVGIYIETVHFHHITIYHLPTIKAHIYNIYVFVILVQLYFNCLPWCFLIVVMRRYIKWAMRLLWFDLKLTHQSDWFSNLHSNTFFIRLLKCVFMYIHNNKINDNF